MHTSMLWLNLTTVCNLGDKAWYDHGVERHHPDFRPRRVIDTISGGDAYGSLPVAELSALFANSVAADLPKGTVLFTPEDTGERVYVLRKGLVDLYRLTLGGKRLVTRRINTGSVFGIMGLLGQRMQGNFAEAIEDSVVGSVDRDAVLDLLASRPDIAVRLLELAGERLRLVEERLVAVVHSPVAARLANFLLTAMDPNGCEVANFTQAEIADIVGAARPTVSEGLGRFRSQGMVLLKRNCVVIVDRRGLEEIAEGFHGI